MRGKSINWITQGKKYTSSLLDNPAYPVILGTINYHRLLILVNIHANLLAAAFEGTTLIRISKSFESLK